MMGSYFMKETPFKDIYIHPLIRDEKGQKMSKSKGNVIDPLELIEKYSADALRFTLLSMASPGTDVKLSEDRVKGYRNFLNNNFMKTLYNLNINWCFFNQFFPKDIGKKYFKIIFWIYNAWFSYNHIIIRN